MDLSSFVAAGSRRTAFRRSISNLISSFHHASFVGPSLTCCVTSLPAKLLLRICNFLLKQTLEAPKRGGCLAHGDPSRTELGPHLYMRKIKAEFARPAESFC